MSKLITTALLGLVLGLVMAPAAFAQTGTSPVEGERFSKPSGTQVVLGDQYSGGKALKITSSQAVPTKQVTITETTKVRVRAHAGQRGGSPTLTIRVDGVSAGTRRITSNVLSDYLYSGITLQPGTYKIGLKGGDITQGRNVFVDVVSFPAVEPPPDTAAPETTITAGPEQYSTSQNESATFEFTSSEPNSTFECKITSGSFGQAIKGDDVGFWHPCTSPMTYSPLRDDNITFQVRAIDAAGNVDPTPAETIFTVQRPGPSLQITNGPGDRSTIDADSVTFEWTTDGATPVDSYCQFRSPSGWVELFNSCSSPKTYQLTEDGGYLFNVFVEDATGNSTSMERQFIVDTSSS
jgi:hypothetical protein